VSKTFGKLFGDKDKQVVTSQTPTGFNSLAPEAQKMYTTALQNAQGLTAQNFSPAPITAQQQQAADYFGTPINQISPEQFNTGLSTFMNPYDEQVIQNAIRDLYTQQQGGFSDIAAIASDAGGFGSNRRGLLESELQKNFLQTVGDVSATGRANNFEQAASRTIADIGQTRQLNQQNMQSLFDVGTSFRNANTAAQNAPAQLQQYLASLAGMLSGGGGTGYTRDTGLVGQITGALGPAGTQAAIAAAASDSRLKENIKQVSQNGKFDIYEFNYINQPTRWRGVMAQDVLKIMPQAVIVIKGYLHVLYDMIGIKMEVVNG